MASKHAVRGIRDTLASGTILGNISSAAGPAQPINLTDLAAKLAPIILKSNLNRTVAKSSVTLPVGANPSATGSDTAVNGSSPNFMRADGAPAIQKASNVQFGLVKGDGTSISITAGVASTIGGGSNPFHPGYQSGRWYWPPLTFSLGILSCPANDLFVVPFFVSTTTTFTKMGIWITSGGGVGSQIELGIYANNNGIPGSLVQDVGTVSANTTGAVTLTGKTITLNPGWYFLTLWPSASVSVEGVAQANWFWIYGLSSTPTTVLTGAGLTGVSAFSAGNLPANFPAVVYNTNGSAPEIVLGL